MTARRPVLTLSLDGEERAVVTRVIRASLRRGPVEYDPTRLVTIRARLGAAQELTLPAVDALVKALMWVNSAEQRRRWSKVDVALTQRIRRVLEATEPVEAGQGALW